MLGTKTKGTGPGPAKPKRSREVTAPEIGDPEQRQPNPPTLADLPLESLQRILSYLPTSDIKKCVRCKPLFHAAASRLWKSVDSKNRSLGNFNDILGRNRKPGIKESLAEFIYADYVREIVRVNLQDIKAPLADFVQACENLQLIELYISFDEPPLLLELFHRGWLSIPRNSKVLGQLHLRFFDLFKTEFRTWNHEDVWRKFFSKDTSFTRIYLDVSISNKFEFEKRASP